MVAIWSAGYVASMLATVGFAGKLSSSKRGVRMVKVAIRYAHYVASVLASIGFLDRIAAT
jgi:hypothetical protein